MEIMELIKVLIVTVFVLQGIVLTIGILENIRPLWRWIEKQDWWNNF